MRGSRTRGPAAQYNRMTAAIRQAAAAEIGKHRRLLRTGRDGRILSALMLPQLWLATPAGYGVLTTTGRKTGRPRHKCVRVIQRGDRAYLVALRLSHIAVTSPTAVQAWVHNIRANANVRLRIRGGDFDTGSCFAAPFSRRTTANAPCTCAACPRERKSKNCTATGSRPESRLRSIWRRYAYDHCSNCSRDRKPVSER